jgi:hypothetical protein
LRTSSGRSAELPNRAAPQRLATLDLLDYPDQVARRVGREGLNALAETKPLVLARRSAKVRAMTGRLGGQAARA